MFRLAPFILLLLSSCVSPRETRPGQETSPDLIRLEHEILALVNSHRAALGMNELAPEPVLTREARLHSQAMADRGGPVSHDGFSERTQEVKKKLRTRRIAENVASNSGYDDPAAVAFRGWLESEGHRINIEGHFRLTGIGVARNQYQTYYFTQLFVLD